MWQRSPPLCDHSCKRARTFNVCSMSDRAMKGDINLSPTCCSRIFPLLLNVNPSTFLFPFSKLAVVCIFCIVSPCILGSQFWKRPCQLGGLQNVGGNVNHIDGMCLELIEDLEPAEVEQWYPSHHQSFEGVSKEPQSANSIRILCSRTGNEVTQRVASR